MFFLSSRVFNIICCLLHFWSGVIMAIATSQSRPFGVDGRVRLCITEPSEMNTFAPCVLYSNPSIFQFLACFSFITSFFHFIYFSLDGNHAPYLRFIEYSITAPIMSVVIGILTGINNIFTLIALAGLTMATMLFGFIQETNYNKTSYSAFIFGCVPYSFMWLIISWQFIRATQTFDVPSFVSAIYVLEVILFSSFAFVQYFNNISSIINSQTADGLYNFLSLVSKMLLVWLSFGGIVGQQSQ